MTDLIEQFIAANQSNTVLAAYLEKLTELKQQWLSITDSVAKKAQQNPEEIGAVSVDYLYFYIYVVYCCHRLKNKPAQVSARVGLFY